MRNLLPIYLLLSCLSFCEYAFSINLGELSILDGIDGDSIAELDDYVYRLDDGKMWCVNYKNPHLSIYQKRAKQKSFMMIKLNNPQWIGRFFDRIVLLDGGMLYQVIKNEGDSFELIKIHAFDEGKLSITDLFTSKWHGRVSGDFLLVEKILDNNTVRTWIFDMDLALVGEIPGEFLKRLSERFVYTGIRTQSSVINCAIFDFTTAQTVDELDSIVKFYDDISAQQSEDRLTLILQQGSHNRHFVRRDPRVLTFDVKLRHIVEDWNFEATDIPKAEHDIPRHLLKDGEDPATRAWLKIADHIYLVTQNGLAVIDLVQRKRTDFDFALGNLLATINRNFLSGIGLMAFGKYLFIAAGGLEKLIIFDTEAQELTSTVDIGFPGQRVISRIIGDRLMILWLYQKKPTTNRPQIMGWNQYAATGPTENQVKLLTFTDHLDTEECAIKFESAGNVASGPRWELLGDSFLYCEYEQSLLQNEKKLLMFDLRSEADDKSLRHLVLRKLTNTNRLKELFTSNTSEPELLEMLKQFRAGMAREKLIKH